MSVPFPRGLAAAGRSAVLKHSSGLFYAQKALFNRKDLRYGTFTSAGIFIIGFSILCCLSSGFDSEGQKGYVQNMAEFA